MKKKKFLTMCVVLTLCGGTAFAIPKPTVYWVDKDADWHDVDIVAQGSRAQYIWGGDTVYIAEGATLTMDHSKDPGLVLTPGGMAVLLAKGFGDSDENMKMYGGGNFIARSSEKRLGQGVYITSEQGPVNGKVIVENVNLDFQDFQYGFLMDDSEVNITNNEVKLSNHDVGIEATNDSKFTATTKAFSVKNSDVGILSQDSATSTVQEADSITFTNNKSAVQTEGAGEVSLSGKTLKMTDNGYGVESRGKKVTINVQEFNFINSKEASATAIYGGGDTKVDVTAGKAELNGQIMAENNAEIQFLEDPDAGNDQLIGVYSPFGDAVSAGTDSGTAKIGFKANTVINSQGDEEYHADKQGVRTIAAIRALRNSEISLDHAVGIYGDVIAGKGTATEGTESAEGDSGSTEPAAWNGGKIKINSVSGAEFKGDVLAGNKGTIDFTLNNGSYEGRVDDYADATLKNIVFRPKEFDVAVTDGGTVNMTLNHSTWTARGQNFVTTLAFGEEGGFVDLSKDENNSVTIRNLTGDGTFNMLLNSEDHSKSDMLYIGKNEGNQTINIVGGITGGLENISKDNPLRFATVGIDTDSDVPEVNNSGIRAYTRDAGALNLEYVVAKEDFNKNDTENEKYNGSGNGQGVDKPGNDFVENELVGDRNAVNWIITGAKEAKPSDAGKTIIDMSKINYSNAVYMVV